VEDCDLRNSPNPVFTGFKDVSSGIIRGPALAGLFFFPAILHMDKKKPNILLLGFR
jgi:hypothetical protein